MFAKAQKPRWEKFDSLESIAKDRERQKLFHEAKDVVLNEIKNSFEKQMVGKSGCRV